MNYNFYLPEYNDPSLTGKIGGDITSTVASGYLGELHAHRTAPPSGADGVYQYRKLFIKNESDSDSVDTRVWLSAVERPNQISIGTSANMTGEIDNAVTEPTNVLWYSPSGYSDGLSLGTISAAGYANIWVRQYLVDISESDNYATYRLNVGGLIQ